MILVSTKKNRSTLQKDGAPFTLEMLLEELEENCAQGNGLKFTPIGQDVECDPESCADHYRRIDGVCNNLDSKLWGATGTPLRRFSPTEYDGEFLMSKTILIQLYCDH